MQEHSVKRRFVLIVIHVRTCQERERKETGKGPKDRKGKIHTNVTD